MGKYKKSDYGYLKAYKKNKLIWTVMLGAMIAFIAITTFIMYGDTKRVGIIFAILITLPFAKFFIAWILAVKYKPLSSKEYEKISNASTYLLFDMVVTRYEGMKHYSVICVKNGKLIAYVKEKDLAESQKEYEKWLNDICEDKKYDYKVKIFDNFDTFAKKVESISEPNDNTRLVDRHMRERICDSSL